MKSPDFKYRSNEIELMDDLHSSGQVIDQTLRELDTINRWLGGNHATINGLDILLQKRSSTRAIRIVDLGCGGGEMLKLMADWARRRRQKIELIGIDANPNIVSFAEKHTHQYDEITYQAINIFSDEFDGLEYDIATSTLFTHHFTDDELVTLFSKIKSQASMGMVINDIHRHWFAYYSIKYLTAAFSKSEMVKNDAAVSVLRSFTKVELEQILNDAGVVERYMQWMWAFRWQVVGFF